MTSRQASEQDGYSRTEIDALKDRILALIERAREDGDRDLRSIREQIQYEFTRVHGPIEGFVEREE